MYIPFPRLCLMATGTLRPYEHQGPVDSTYRKHAEFRDEVITDFRMWLDHDRARRELTFQLRRGLAQMAGHFSYTRQQGMTLLRELLQHLPEEHTPLLAELQRKPDLNVVHGTFLCILRPPVGMQPPYASTVTTQEKVQGLLLIEGMCLVNTSSRRVVRDHNGVDVFLGNLASTKTQLQTASLDALLATLMDSRANQEAFRQAGGPAKVVQLMKKTTTARDTRIKCAEALAVLATYLDECAVDEGTADYTHGVTQVLRTDIVKELGDDMVKTLERMVTMQGGQPDAEGFLNVLDAPPS